MKMRVIHAASSLLVSLVVAMGLGACGDESSGARGPECQEGEVKCSEDGYDVMTCKDGRWSVEHCMAEQMKLCEAGKCVEPWKYGNPVWDKCEDEPRATKETLHEKAAYYERLAKRLHVHPRLQWMSSVTVACKQVECKQGQTPPCEDCSQPVKPEKDLTYQDVVQWHAGDNDGLWSALYLTAEAYRYAVTHDREALDMIKVLLEGQRTRMEITGVPGLYTRHFVPKGIKGISCPEDPMAYVRDKEKDDNMTVLVGDDGCLQSYDPEKKKFVSSKVCGLKKYAGWCFTDNVSQDEYSGHMLAHAAVARFVDDEQVQKQNAALLEQIGQHLMGKHPLELWDWDGRRTEHGKLWPARVMSGYMAAMSLAFVETVAYGTKSQKYRDWIDRCLYMRDGPAKCIAHPGAADKPYDDLLEPVGMFFGCRTNWNVLSMYMMSAHTLLLVEQDPVVRAKAQHALLVEAFDPPNQQFALRVQHNALFDFIFAADKKLGPGSDGPAYEAVRDGICMLKQFPASEHQLTRSCDGSGCEEACKDRFDRPMMGKPLEPADRCMSTFLWWGSPYSYPNCKENLRVIEAPSDYLLAYWMGRYYGFIDANM